MDMYALQGIIFLQDLIPILLGCGDSPILRNDVIRLLVNLTQPAYLCFGGNFPKGKDADMMKCFMEVNRSAIGPQYSVLELVLI